MTDDVAVIVAQFSAAVPVFFLAYRRLRGRPSPPAHQLVAWGFFVSLVADMIADLTAGSWIAVPWYMVLQFGLFGAAMLTDGARQMVLPVMVYVVIGGLFWLAMMQHRNDPAPYTEFMRYWYPYQTTRLASFALFVRAAWAVPKP